MHTTPKVKKCKKDIRRVNSEIPYFFSEEERNYTTTSMVRPTFEIRRSREWKGHAFELAGTQGFEPGLLVGGC